VLGILDLLRQRDDAIGRRADLAIVGTAKNVGKTTTLNWLLERLGRAEGGDTAGRDTLGLTSVGRDGEDLDAVTDLPKPRIVPPLGTLVATSETSAERSGSRLSLVTTTPFRTALGQIAIYRVAAVGPVEVSGAVTVAETAEIREWLHRCGADRVMVDGAIDRRASASARVADAVVLATGLALLDAGGGRLAGPREVPGRVATEAPPIARTESVRIAATVEKTAAILRMLVLPASGPVSAPDAGHGAASVATGDPLRSSRRLTGPEGIPAGTASVPAGMTGVLLPGGRFEPWPGGSPLDHAESLVAWLPPEAEALLLAGALTDGVANALLRSGRAAFRILVPDGTHVLCSSETFDTLAARGFGCHAAQPISVLAITANPTSPHVAGVDAQAFVTALQAALPIPVYDLIATPSPP